MEETFWDFWEIDYSFAQEDMLPCQLLFDEGIAAKGRSLVEQMMNVDLKNAYLFGLHWAKTSQPYTVDILCELSAKVMRRTGSEYSVY